MGWKIPTEWRARVAAEPSARFRGLSARLAAVAQAVPEGARVADIGADHGHLGAALLREGRASFVWAIDLSALAIEGARQALARDVTAGRAEACQGDGLHALDPCDEPPDCIVLAGVGGITAVRIIDEGLQLQAPPEHVIVQPSNDEDFVRVELLRLGYGLLDESLVADGQRIFTVLVFGRKGGVRELDGPHDDFVGPLLQHSGTATLAAWLAIQESWLEDMLAHSPASPERDLRVARLTRVRALRR